MAQGEPQPGPQQPRLARSLASYLRLLFAVAAVLYLLPFVLVRLPGLDRWGESFYERAIDFGFQTAGQNADVVIFGDSSAFYGLDPRALSAALRMRVLNLPNTAGSLPVTGDLALRRYLRHNRPPRLIVFYFTRWDLDYTRPNPHVFEGEEVLARFGSLAQLERFALEHPADTLRFPMRYYAAEPRGVLNELRQPTNRMAAIRASGGHGDALGPALPTDCVLQPAQLSVQNGAAIRALLVRYRTVQTQVLLVYAPLPACQNLAQLPPLPAPGVAAPPAVLPPDQFRDDSNYSHPLATAVPQVTSALLQLICPVLQGDHDPR